MRLRTVCGSNLAPDYAEVAAAHRLVCTVHESDPLTKIPVRLLGIADALESEQTDVGVGVALAALVADVPALHVDWPS